MLIEITTPVECRVGKYDAQRLKSVLSYKKTYFRPRKDGKGRIKQTYMKQVWSRRGNKHWYFWRGHLPRVLRFLKKHNIPVKVTRSWAKLQPTSPPHLPSITLRPDQLDLIAKATKKQFGVIQAPTGSGKTIVQLGLVSQFPNCRILFLAHTLDLIDQTAEELVKFGFGVIGKDIQVISGQHKTSWSDFHGRIVLATMQSMAKRDYEEYWQYFDIVIVDETHRVSGETGQYAQILGNCYAQMRIGFTATLPTKPEAQMMLEAFIGPVIGELTRQEAAEKGIIAKPKIRLIKVDTELRIRSLKNYQEAYKRGIVENTKRNGVIIDLVRENIANEKISLIMVNHIQHGKRLQEIAEEAGFRLPFMQGETDKDERMKTKKDLEAGKIKAAIATTVWKEGINIPSLNVIINAGGGKDELPVLQTIGRGLRRTGSKNTVEIVDFIDNSNFFFLDHFASRISTYSKEGWL